MGNDHVPIVGMDCEPKVDYLVSMGSNDVLKRKAQSAMKRARRASEISGQTEHVYGECRYATKKTWPWKRRVLYKAEVVRAADKEAKDNPRFVITNLKQSPQWIRRYSPEARQRSLRGS
jgi:hypothetical protein